MSEAEKDRDDDLDLFREAVSDVRPLAAAPRVADRPPPPRPRPRQRELDDARVLERLLDPPSDTELVETGEELIYLRPGLQKKTLRKLRRGQYSIQDSIDLHHMNLDAARATVLTFIDDSLRAGMGCVRVIHGKGLRSRKGPRLKGMVDHVLRRHPAVMAFASCRPVDGGTGAVMVLLRRKALPRR